MLQSYGIINEVGDLGLGFDPLSPKDQEVLKEQEGYQYDKNKDSEKESE